MGVRARVNAIPLATFASAGMGADYQSLNGTGTTEPCFLIRIVNDSDEDVTISYNGVNDHEYVLAGEVLQLPFQLNTSAGSGSALLAKGTQIFGKGIAGAGNIRIIGYFTDPLP